MKAGSETQVCHAEAFRGRPILLAATKILGPYYDYLDSVHTKKDIQKIKGKIRSSRGD